jgi:hypothetical protein
MTPPSPRETRIAKTIALLIALAFAVLLVYAWWDTAQRCRPGEFARSPGFCARSVIEFRPTPTRAP